MAEYSVGGSSEQTEEDKLEQKRKKKRYIPSFLETYLKPRKLETEDDSEDGGDEADSLWKKLLKPLRKVFDGIVPKPELITEPAPEEALTNTYETTPSEPEYGVVAREVLAQPEESELVVDHNPVEGGELRIDHADDELEMSEEMAKVELPSAAEPEEAENTENAPAQAEAPEQVGQIVERMSKESAGVGGSSALLSQELLRKQRERKTHTDVRRLKRRTLEQNNRQKQLENRQKELEKQLEGELGQENAGQQRIAAIERAQTQPNTGQSFENFTESAVSPEISRTRPDLNPQQFKELLELQPQNTKPEEILHMVEAAADQDVPIEGLYERHHEIKDDSASLLGSAGRATGVVSTGTTTPNHTQQPPAHFAPTQSPSPPQPPGRPYVPPILQKDAYRQAVRGGFWAAVVLLVLFLIAAIVT